MLRCRVLSLAINIPGPVAVARLRDLGASVVKIEPLSGDPLAEASRAWYDDLHRGLDVRVRNLKEPATNVELAELLDQSDLLITSMRPSALVRAGLDRESLAPRYPGLCQVAIFGYERPQADRAGHDLTYQASSGLVQPPSLPRTLEADLAGAERVVSMALATLLSREQRGEGAYAEVALSAAATEVAAPWRYGLTRADGLLGGALPGYNLYETADGWIALAALEAQFWRRLLDALSLDAADQAALARIFLTQSTAHWTAWATLHDIPLEPVP